MKQNIFPADGYDLYYETHGQPDNPPLMMIHGYTNYAGVWRTTIEHLQEHFYCIALDLLGHGRSPIDSNGDYSIEAQGKRVLLLADHLKIEQFYLLGHSMGGQISKNIAANLAPERVKKLVDVDGVTSGKLTEEVHKNAVKPVQQIYNTPFAPLLETVFRWTNVRYRWGARRQFATWWYNFDARDFEWWREDRFYVNQPNMRHTWYRAVEAILATDLTADLHKITCPTLIIFGDHDNVVPSSEGKLAHELIPNSRLEFIAECGHFPMFEKTEQYNQLVKAFLLE